MKTLQKYLVNIEFRFNGVSTRFSGQQSKTITIAICDSYDDACMQGNKYLEKLETKFPIHIFPDGRTAIKERFSKNGGCFGTKKTLISNLAYLKTPFTFYAKITTLNFEDIDQTLDFIKDSMKK